MPRINLSQRMYSIHDIIRLLNTGELSIQPKYQRRRTTWPLPAKTALIDTILNNFPLPPIYLRDYVDELGKRRKEIIDGQQRISTITEFYHNQYALSKNIINKELSGLTFEQMPESERLVFEDFEVSFISIRGALDGDIVSIFSRLNSYSLPLNTQEKLNSAFTGELKTLVYELATEYYMFWTDFKILTPENIARMSDASLVTDLVFAIIHGVKGSNATSIKKMYETYDEDFPNKNDIYFKFNKTMSVMGEIFQAEEIAKTFKTKAMFFSLFLVVYSKLFGFEGENQQVKGSVDMDVTITNLHDFCGLFNSDYFAEKAMFKQATGNTAQRIYRHDVISKLVV